MALPFFEDDLTKLYDDALSDKKTIPNEELEKIRKTFGVDPKFLLSDSNDYTMDAPVEEIDDGIASIDTGLPIYVQDGNDNNFLQYSSMDGAPKYIRPTKIDAPINQEYKLQDPTVMKMANFDELFGPKTFTDSLEKVRTIPGEERFILPEEKKGILESIKDKGFDILDFIKGGGITGAIAKTFLGEQDPRATFLRYYYGGKDLSNLTSTGSIATGLMKGYNPVSGNDFLNKISGGILPGETFGLQKSYTKRIDNIRDMLTDKYAGISADMTDEELEKYMSTPEGIKALKLNIPNHSAAIENYFKLKEERQAEAEALKTQFNREEQRYKDDPGAKSYSGGFDKSTNNYYDPFDPGETE